MPKRANSSWGKRSLLTTGVNLWNAHFMGEEVTEPLALQEGWWPPCGGLVYRRLGRRCSQLWVRTVAADTCQSDSHLISPKLSDLPLPDVFILVNWNFTNPYAETNTKRTTKFVVLLSRSCVSSKNGRITTVAHKMSTYYMYMQPPIKSNISVKRLV